VRSEAGAGRSQSAWPLTLVTALAIFPRLYAAMHNPIAYDGYWHVFIARNLTREYRALAHPPLFPLLLKASDAMSHSRFAYEGVSLLAGVGGVFLVGRILQRLRTSASVSVLGALAMAFSPSAIGLSGLVEGNALCVLFVLAAFLSYLDLLRWDPLKVPRRSRVAFAAFVSLALLSHYFAALFFAACLAAPLLVAIVRPEYRRALVRALPDRRVADLVTVLPPVLIGGILYWFLARPWVRSLNHLPDFYLQRGTETVAKFLLRNLSNSFNLFSPVLLSNQRLAAALVFGFVIFVFLAAVGERRVRADGDDRVMPSAVLLILLAIGMAGGVLDRYPFGGAMRHQILLFLFALLAGFVAFDWIVERARRPSLRALLIALCSGAIGANVVVHVREWLPDGPEPFESEARMFWRDFPDAREIHVDSFNMIGFFAQHYRWDWRFAGQEPSNPSVERYDVSRGERHLTLVAHRDRWNMDFRDPTLYKSLEGSGWAAGPRCLTVFCVHQILKPAGRDLANVPGNELEDRIPVLAREADLTIKKLHVRGDDVFAELCSYDCYLRSSVTLAQMAVFLPKGKDRPSH
jgi:hypothetical protein